MKEKLYSLREIAEQANFSYDKILADRAKGFLKGREVGGVFVFTKDEVDAYLSGKPAPEPNGKLLTAKDAADILDTSKFIVYALAGEGVLDAAMVNGRSIHPVAIFEERQVRSKQVKSAVINRDKQSGRKPQKEVVELVEQDGDKWVVKGTLKTLDGKPFTYSHERSARATARRLLDLPNQYKAGDEVYVSQGQIRTATIVQDVTGIDLVARIRWESGAEEIVRLEYVRGITERQRVRENGRP